MLKTTQKYNTPEYGLDCHATVLINELIKTDFT